MLFRSRNAARGRKLPYDFLATPTYEVWLEDVLARHEQDCQTLALLNSTQPQIVIHNQGIKMHSTELIKILQENPGEVFVLDGEYTEYIGLAEVELMRVIDIEGRLAAVSKEERQSAIDLKIYEDELVRVADFTRVKAVLEARNAERGRQDHGIPATFKAHQNLIKCFTPKTLT